MMKSKYLIAVLAVLLFNGSAISQFGSGLPVVVPDPSSNLVPPLSSASAIPLPELSAQDLALLERAAQANPQASVEAPAVQITSVLDDEEETDTPQSNQGAVVAEVAEAPSFMQIISLVQDLVDARGSKETQGVIEDIKECLSKITDDAEYVNTLAEICGQLKELSQEIVQQISELLGSRLRSAVAKWQLTAKNYSSFIDLAAVFPGVVTETMVAKLRTIIERAIEEGDLTKLIIALIELPSLPEGLARMLLELSNRHADKFMAELKEGRGLYAFMQLISRYPDRLSELLQHGNVAILEKVLGLSSSSEGVEIGEEKLETFLRSFAISNPAEFVHWMSVRSWIIATGLGADFLLEEFCPIEWVVRKVAGGYPELLLRCTEDSGVKSLAEISPSRFAFLVDNVGILDDGTQLREGLRFLAIHDPGAFIKLLEIKFASQYSGWWLDILREVAKDHSKLLIKCSEDDDFVSLAEREPEAFVNLVKRADILNEKQLQKGLEFLLIHHPEAFVGLLSSVCLSFSDKVPSALFPLVIEVAQDHPNLVIRCTDEDKIGSLVEHDPRAFVALLERDPTILDDAQLRSGLEFLMTHNLGAFFGLLACGSSLSPILIKIAVEHPDLFGCSDDKEAENFVQEFVNLIRNIDHLNNEQLQERLEFLITHSRAVLFASLRSLNLSSYPERRSMLMELLKKHRDAGGTATF